MNRVTCGALFGIVLLFPVGSFAQTASIPQRLSMHEAIQIAAAHNPQAVSARALVDVAEANRLDARLRPNPSLTVETELFDTQSPFFPNTQELAIAFDQEIETAGRRRLRAGAAGSAVEAAKLTARDRLRRLELAVRRAYLQLALAQADAAVARTSLEDIDRVLTVGRERVKVGEAARSEVSRLEVERLRFAEDAFSADLALKNARAALLTLLGSPDLTQQVEATDSLIPASDGPKPVAATLASAVVQSPAESPGRPDLLAAREELKRTETETRLQRALRSPNVTVGGGYKRDFGTNSVIFGATVPLPLWNRNQGGVARALAEQRIAEANLTTIEFDVRLNIQQAMNAVDTNRARAEYIEQQVLASARESREVVSESYRLGAADLIDFLDAQRAFRDTQRTYNRALFEYRVSIFELQAARGTTSIQ